MKTVYENVDVTFDSHRWYTVITMTNRMGEGEDSIVVGTFDAGDGPICCTLEEWDEINERNGY